MNEAAETFDVPAIRTRLLASMGKYASDYPHQLERHYPRILAHIADLWGTARLDWYLESLMLPERQERQGFPLDVAMEMLRLTKISPTRSKAPAVDPYWSAFDESARDRKAPAEE